MRRSVGEVVVTQAMDARDASTVADAPAAGGLRVALRGGAVVWLLLLVAGFFAPGGWTWGLAGPVGHVYNYVISLWVVGLVLAPVLASFDPVRRTSAVQIYLLAVLALVVSTFRGEPMKLIADGPPLVTAALCIGAVVLFHPRRSLLLRP
jgi:hypothetical protein